MAKIPGVSKEEQDILAKHKKTAFMGTKVASALNRLREDPDNTALTTTVVEAWNAYAEHVGSKMRMSFTKMK